MVVQRWGGGGGEGRTNGSVKVVGGGRNQW